MNLDVTIASNPSTNEHNAMNGMMDTSIDMSTGGWPQLETLSWDDMQLEVDWSSHDSSYTDVVLESLDMFGGDGSAREVLEILSPGQTQAYPQSQPTSGIFEQHEVSNTGNMDKCTVDSGSAGNIPMEKFMNYPSVVITQLSQLSMSLSSLRYSSYALAKGAESFRQTPLIDGSAFEAVAAWLAPDHGSMNPHSSVHAPTESLVSCSTSETKPRGHGILHEVFSASHHLLEILRNLQLNATVDLFSSPAPNSICTASAAQSNGSQQQPNNTLQIIRHMVMACDALLLEIYVAVLIALQHDAYPGTSTNTTALGDVQMVLVVQLCSYLIERQQQAVDMCLAPQTPLSPPSISGPFPQKLDLSNSQQLPPTPVLDMADREALSGLKHQVQQRLAHLRQTLRCR
jgi:hypothetical protein